MTSSTSLPSRPRKIVFCIDTVLSRASDAAGILAGYLHKRVAIDTGMGALRLEELHQLSRRGIVEWYPRYAVRRGERWREGMGWLRPSRGDPPARQIIVLIADRDGDVGIVKAVTGGDADFEWALGVVKAYARLERAARL